MAELETPDVLAEEGLVPTRTAGTSLLDRWVAGDPEAAIKRLETMVKMLEQLRAASIKATYPPDWIIHVSKDADGNIIRQTGYLQDSGAERAGKVWGIEVGSPAIEREDFPDGTYTYHMVAEAWSKITGERLDYAEGSRWSGDSFFARQVRDAGDKVDPTDVRKAAYANLHGRAVRALSGLNGVPIETLRQAGLDITKVVMVGYDKGGKGGESTGASVGTTDAVMPWGNAKGTKVSELAEKDLAFYLGAYERDLGDPAKARFKANNERMLAALKAEKERRARSAEQDAAGGTPAPAGGGEAAGAGGGAGDKPTTRGSRIADLNTRLSDAVGGNKRGIAPLLKAVTTELFGLGKEGLSELSDEELEKLNAVPEDVLAKTWKAVEPQGAAKGGTK